MKLTAILLLSAFLTVSAGSNAQKITLNEVNAPLQKLFKEIWKQSGFQFVYTDKTLEGAKPVTINVKDEPLENVLKLCFAQQPFDFTITDGAIVIKQKTLSAVEGPATTDTERSRSVDVRGKLVNENNEPVPGASIKVKGTTNGTTTNANGEFSLTGVDENATLVFTGTNIEKFERKLSPFGGGKGEVDLGTITARIKIASLNEVIVNKGYYTEKQKLSVSNVGRVTAKDIEKQPVSNPLLALQGRVPGLFITQANGLPGGGVTVRIQGKNSIGNGNDPLYIVDGVPYISQTLATTSPAQVGILGASGGPAGSGGGNPLSYLNSSDIESIEILKDADATAIYGSRAANGAILITTKRGKQGATRFDFNLQQGFGKVAKFAELLNTQQYLEMRKEAYSNDGVALPIRSANATSNFDLTFWDSTRNTNWQKELIGRTVRYTNLSASISGGANNLSYLIGGTYHKETSVFPGDFSDTKGSFHFNLNNISSNQKVRIQLTANYISDKNELPNLDLTSLATRLPPNAPALYNPDGTLNWAPNSAGTSTWANPLANIHKLYQNKGSNLISNLLVGYSLSRSLEIKSSFGFTSLDINEFVANPLIINKPEQQATSTRFSYYTNNKVKTWIVEPQINYRRQIDKGLLEIIFGATVQEQAGEGVQLLGIGYNNDAVLKDIRSATTVSVTSSINSKYGYGALFGRASFNWNDKFLFNAVARRDGSSRFGPKNQYHSFGSVGLGWIFSNESFLKNSAILDFGKLRGSFGTTGNDQIGDYRFMSLYSPVTSGIPYQNTAGIGPNGLSNPYLQWEETEKLQVGIDLSFFKERFVVAANYIRNRSSNQLLLYNLPSVTGSTGILENFPATVQNSAWELMFKTTNVKNQDFTWTTSFNVTLPKNKLIEFPNLSKSSYSYLIVGQPLGAGNLYIFKGVDPISGLYVVSDKDGNPTTSPDPNSALKTLIKNVFPKYGGLQNTISYKGLEIDFLFQFVKQIANKYFTNFPPGHYGGGLNNQPVSVLNRWQKTGDITDVQKFSQNLSLLNYYSNMKASDFLITDASYIRLKNLSLSYQLPKKLQQKARLQNCKFYLQGQNLFTITKYKGLDPETLSFIALPPLRVITAGIQIGL